MPGKCLILSLTKHLFTAPYYLALFCWLLPYELSAGECQAPVAKIVSLQGVVEAKSSGRLDWVPVSQNDTFCAGEELRVRPNSRAGLYLNNETFIRLNEQSSIRFPQQSEESFSWLELIQGIAHFMSRVRQSFEIRTAYVNAAIDGTEFTVQVTEKGAQVSVIEGAVITRNDFGSIRLTDGQSALANAGQAPVLQLKVKPRDAVQWALYYPAVLAFDRDQVQGPLRRSMDAYQQGNLSQAFSALADVEEPQRDARFYTYRATLNLSVGRIDSARADIDRSRKLQPNNANALALKSIIATVQNDADTALALAQQATSADQNAAGPRIAQSYALQARFELESAGKAVTKATELEPNNALAWARLAELWASLGDLQKSIDAAERAVELNPNLSRAQTILGFSYLIQLDTEKAKSAFSRAVELDTADPLARLGLGLAEIRDGDLEQGRLEMEIATNLDPSNSLVRSYLGKAYYEEQRNKEAETEFDLAKQLDPLDPTPWFYSAVERHAENRPIEALRDLQQSIQRNENRAVFRSRLLLDEDAAARNVNLAAIYADLGFEMLAVTEASKALTGNQRNHAAHRFLADAFLDQPQQGISRVSELLQAQLYQPLSARAESPRATIRELSGYTGLLSLTPGLGEYGVLFDQPGPNVYLSGQLGNQDTGGGEVVVSGLADAYAYSLGYFRFDTDGFRENADVSQEAYSAFLQTAVNERFDLQFEIRQRDSEQGDLRFKLNPDFVPNERRELQHQTYRVGGHYEIAPNTELIASFMYTDREETLIRAEEPMISLGEVVSQRDGYSGELQITNIYEPMQFVLGGGVYQIDVDRVTGSTVVTIPPYFPGMDPIVYIYDPVFEAGSVDAETLYFYATGKVEETLAWTLGMSFDKYDDSFNNIEAKQFNPKVGFEWQLGSRNLLRGAYFKTLKRNLPVQDTIEPTQIAGFSQFFDDVNGAKATNYGLALDSRFNENIDSTASITRRETLSRLTDNKLREDSIGLQFYWKFSDRWALSGGYRWEYDEFTSGGVFRLKNRTVPLSARYDDPHGYFGRLAATYVKQDLVSGTESMESDFTTWDLELGYRLPRRAGRLAIGVFNLFDADFAYQDNGYKVADQFDVYIPFTPERTARLSFQLQF